MNPRQRRWLVWSAVAVVVVAVGIGIALMAQNSKGDGAPANGNGKKKGEKEAPPAAPVELTEVRRGSISTYLQSTTTLDARNSAVLVARAQGQVVELMVEEGQWAQQGAVLARLDDTEARLAVERAELAAEMATRDFERGKQLGQQGFSSQKELDDVELKRRNAQVELEQARYNLAQTRLVAPFSGRVVDRMVNLGETVTPGKECFRVVDFNPVLARLYFPERELPRVHVGQEAMVTLDAQPGKQFPARVTLVNPVVDKANGTFKVTLELPNPDGSLRPGAFAHVKLKTGSFAETTLMPRRGLLSEDGEQFVFVARGDSVVRAPVTVGAVEGELAQILSGVAQGDRVVTVGQGGLKPGAKIKVVKF